MWTEEQITIARRMKAQGRKSADIAAALGKNTSTVIYFLWKHGYSDGRPKGGMPRATVARVRHAQIVKTSDEGPTPPRRFSWEAGQ